MLRAFACLALLLPGVVTRIVDGDTIEAGKRDVRLQGIDAPESSQPNGGEATASLQGLILDRRVRLEVQGTDRYDRLIALVYSEEPALRGSSARPAALAASILAGAGSRCTGLRKLCVRCPVPNYA